MPIFTDPSRRLYYFQEVINDPSLTEEEKQSRLLDLDYNALSRKGDLPEGCCCHAACLQWAGAQ
jgi:hypothetical protein